MPSLNVLTNNWMAMALPLLVFITPFIRYLDLQINFTLQHLLNGTDYRSKIIIVFVNLCYSKLRDSVFCKRKENKHFQNYNLISAESIYIIALFVVNMFTTLKFMKNY